MKIKKFLATVSLAGLVLTSAFPVSHVMAGNPGDAPVAISACLRHLERDDEGLVMFGWEGKDTTGFKEMYCFWIILDESKLHGSFTDLTEDQMNYLKSNQLKRQTQESFEKQMGKNGNELRTFFGGRFGLETMESLIRSLKSSGNEEYENICAALNQIIVEETVSKATPVTTSSSEVFSASATSTESEDTYSAIASQFGDAARPAELAIDGVVVYYYKGWLPKTSWLGYRITNPVLFENWCRTKGLGEEVVKILVACQNTWIASASSLIWDDTINIKEVFPKEFVEALNSVIEKQSNGVDATTYVWVKETRFGAVIDNSESAKRSIIEQFNRIGISPKSNQALSNPWNYNWMNPVSWRLKTLRQNGDIK